MTGRELPSRAELEGLAKQLKARGAAVSALARGAEPADPAALAKALDKLAKAGPVEVDPVVDQVRGWLAEERATRGPRLSAELRRLCAERDLRLAVVTRQPLELRIPPLSAAVDVDADKAVIGFGREPVERSGAQADALLKAWDKARNALEGRGWKAAEYHASLRQAWRRAAPDGGWAELRDVLPEVALLLQPRKFRLDPTARNFQPYSRARFAYDLWRLRRDRCLAANGLRLTLGSATGGSTRDKKRVFWLEDADGNGQYYLTLRFVREGGAGA